MSLVDMFSQNFRQYYRGKWFKMDSKQGKYFEFSIEWDREKVFNQPVMNLLGEVSKLIIETNYHFDFRAQDVVEMEDGSRWIMDKVVAQRSEINEQANAMFTDNVNTLYRIDLTRLCSEL